MEEKTKRRARRILVVEEDESIRTLISTSLSKAGYEVMTARSGEDGMDFLANGSFDLVLSDLSMSGMDGWAFAWLVKYRSPSTPVGLMTGWDEQEITARMKGSAVDFVLFKPFSFREMLRKVATILEAKP
jgi:two-component system cell cycle sensor histidine kinase/response regulator CckA